MAVINTNALIERGCAYIRGRKSTLQCMDACNCRFNNCKMLSARRISCTFHLQEDQLRQPEDHLSRDIIIISSQ
ncbi:hypothetical protein CEXT_597331 [Caerostris extrusa]|uniref:Uncharacterized protein n=1 Tax=Caerostris extrusa TaxID=172846 RepID=A0AAV4Q496_CAEEX|nr:hypothetical protein CEXT_597331 [Caerostris extrusa]